MTFFIEEGDRNRYDILQISEYENVIILYVKYFQNDDMLMVYFMQFPL